MVSEERLREQAEEADRMLQNTEDGQVAPRDNNIESPREDQESYQQALEQHGSVMPKDEEVAGVEVQGDLETVVNPSTDEMELKKKITELKQQCMELDKDAGAVCLSEANRLDARVTDAIQQTQYKVNNNGRFR